MTPGRATLDDFAVGEEVVTGGRLVAGDDLDGFAALTGDAYPLHVDDAVARAMGFERRIAQGALTFSLAIGLIVESDFFGRAAVALLGVTRMRARRPVVVGDAIRVHGVVTACRPPRRAPSHGVVELSAIVLNQHGTAVMTFTERVLVHAASLPVDPRGAS